MYNLCVALWNASVFWNNQILARSGGVWVACQPKNHRANGGNDVFEATAARTHTAPEKIYVLKEKLHNIPCHLLHKISDIFRWILFSAMHISVVSALFSSFFFWLLFLVHQKSFIFVAVGNYFLPLLVCPLFSLHRAHSLCITSSAPSCSLSVRFRFQLLLDARSRARTHQPLKTHGNTSP